MGSNHAAGMSRISFFSIKESHLNGFPDPALFLFYSQPNKITLWPICGRCKFDKVKGLKYNHIQTVTTDMHYLLIKGNMLHPAFLYVRIKNGGNGQNIDFFTEDCSQFFAISQILP